MSAPARSAGRPRDETRDDAILTAVLDIVGEAGFSGLSMEAIAARAGVGKSTIYRRWDSMAEIVFDAWERCLPGPCEYRSESVRDELIAVYTKLAEDLSAEPLRSILPHILARSSVDAGFEERIRAFTAQRRQVTLARLRKAIESGEMREPDDIETLVDTLVAPVFYRTMVRRLDVDTRYVAVIVDTAIGPYLIG